MRDFNSDSTSGRVSLDVYQTTANELMTMFISKLEEIVKELELCGGDIKLMKSELRDSLTLLELGLPAPLKEKITAKIKSAEKDHALSVQELEETKAQLHKKKEEKREASQAAMDFFKLFLPDMWVAIIQDKDRMEGIERERIEKSERSLAKEKKATDGDGDNADKPSIRSGTSTDIVASHRREMGAAHDEKYHEAHSKLVNLYNARLENIRRAIEIAGGDVTRLDPSIRAEIVSLQTILPDGHLRILNSFLEGKEKGKEVAVELDKNKAQISKELADVTIGIVDLSIMMVSHKPARVLAQSLEVDIKHPLSPSRIEGIQSTVTEKKKGFSMAEMEAFNRRMSGE